MKTVFSSRIAIVAGMFAFLFVATTASDASAQGYRYGILSNGFDRGGSSIIGQPRTLSPNRYGSFRPSYGVNPSIPSYGVGGFGYGYRGGGYGYRGFGYGFAPGVTYGSSLNIGPGGLIQYYQGPVYRTPRYYGPRYGRGW